MTELVLRNRQRVRPVDLRALRRLARAVLEDRLGLTDYALGIHLVAAPEMTSLNETFLGHDGSTDVIAFDHSAAKTAPALHGEVFICLDDAVAQAGHFRTTWQAEVIRYLVHGLLHLRGHDDLDPVSRRRMKRVENHLVAGLIRRFDLSPPARRPRLRP
jgi:probable rRNA maturation factor